MYLSVTKRISLDDSYLWVILCFKVGKKSDLADTQLLQKQGKNDQNSVTSSHILLFSSLALFFISFYPEELCQTVTKMSFFQKSVLLVHLGQCT